jgi:hypothetical protein
MTDLTGKGTHSMSRKDAEADCVERNERNAHLIHYWAEVADASLPRIEDLPVYEAEAP